jgi:hypothetical protein
MSRDAAAAAAGRLRVIRCDAAQAFISIIGTSLARNTGRGNVLMSPVVTEIL